MASEPGALPADPVDLVKAVLDISPLRERVAEHLAGFLSARLGRAPHPDLDRVLLEPVVDLLLRDGKRLRPAFCYWGWRGAGGADCEEVLVAATSLELLHGCALIHDDVMDGSVLRRGGRAVHSELAARHVARGWRGLGDHFGIAGAVVAGDLCLVWADEMLRASGLPPESLTRAGPVFDAMRAETIRGQYLDLITQAEGALRVEDAIAVAQAKTAASTTVGPLRFGATLAGAGEDLLAAYSDYALPLGVAFQLRDDLLGSFGDPGTTGKPSGDDLRDGKCTLLLAEARRRAGAADARRIDALLVEGTDNAVVELRAIIEGSGARTFVEDEVARLGAAALAALQRAPLVDDSARSVLRGLALAVTTFDPLANPNGSRREPGENERDSQQRHSV
ncbi:polyprenyl synthetase family protein [Micromonospora sp. RTP1Z1]|uniref:polyprenyl synthetase family protein n=1 Tax=Micromonospora sp. RTP1Z1 TaxID=2994043 RepID=UPI0029C78730|nr:polyprenyl synthetase family protein [Micromonospora sp. RTP1Z1]